MAKAASKKIQVFQIPYDSGNRGVRMGAGTEHFVSRGLAEVLEGDGHDVRVETIESNAEFKAEIQTQFELYGLLAERVAEARENDRFPLILSGNCGATLGAIAGARSPSLGVIWFDAHGDFNTPETTEGGFLDGMGLAIAAGLCWKKLAAAKIPHFTPLDGSRILHVGGHDFDREERTLFDQTGVAVIDAETIKQIGVRQALRRTISKFGLAETHLHIDLDVLNPKEAPANSYVTEDAGLSVAQLNEAIELIKENLKITSATVAAFDPRFDPQEKTLRAALKLIKKIIA